MDDLQYEALIDEAKQPSHYGQLADADVVLHGFNASCGDRVDIFLKLENAADPHSPITAIGWVGEGCIISRATMSVLAQHILDQGLTVAQASQITVRELEQLVGLEHISTGRIKCVTLGVNTLQLSQS